MPKLVFIALSIFLTFSLNSPNNIYAQEENPKQNYLNQLTKFNASNEEYITARSSYLSFLTATAKNQAFIKTKNYLYEANLLYTQYIKLVSTVGNKVNWQETSINKESQFNTINTELEFLATNVNNIQSAKTLEELPLIAQELEEHINSSTKPKTELILANFNIASIENEQANFNNIAKSLIELTTTRANKDQLSLIANWQSEIEIINTITQEILTEVKSEFENLSETQSPSQEILSKITQAKTELKRSKKLFEEILKIL